MAVIAVAPVVGILLLVFSVYLFLAKRTGMAIKVTWPLLSQTERRNILKILPYDVFLFSIAIGLLLILIFANYAGDLLIAAWIIGLIGSLIFVIALYRLTVGRPRLIALSLSFLGLYGFFEFFGPASALNFDDDLAKYIILPVGLLSRGTFDFGPLGPQMGSASILTVGLQALYLIHAEIKWLAHWDISIALILGLIWITIFLPPAKRSVGKILAVSVAFTASVVLVNTMYVNISAIYLPAVLFSIAGGRLIFIRRRSLLEAVCIGGFAALLYAFKMNYILLGVALLVSYFFLSVFDHRISFNEKASLVLVSIIPFLIWQPSPVLEVVRAISALISGFLRSEGEFADTEPAISSIAPSESYSVFNAIFDLKPAFYGYGVDSYFSINIFMASFFVVGLASLIHSGFNKFLLKGSRSEDVAGPTLVAILAFVILFAQLFMFSKNIGAVDANIRYIMPSVLGLVVTLVVAGCFKIERRRGLSQSALTFLVVAFLGSQIPSAAQKGFQALKFGNILAFPAAREDFMASHTEFIVGGAGKDFAAELQGLMPEGATILAVVGFPTLFDFRRNEILLAEADGDLERFEDPLRFLNDYSVQYIVWQTRGLGVKTLDQWNAWARTSRSRANHAAKSITFLQRLHELSTQCRTFSPVDVITIIQVESCRINQG